MISFNNSGLTEDQVIESRRLYGENILTPPEKNPWWKEFLEKLTDPIIIILLVALALSTGISFYEYFNGLAGFSVFFEPLGILIAILLATVAGFLFEQSANKKFEVLNKVNDDSLVKVIRNGNVCQITRHEVVVGDIVILETGEEVPADGELLNAVSLQINESTLTGEQVCKKTVNPSDFDKDATFPSNHVMRDTTVIDGHGMMRVLKVGDESEYGKVYEGAQIDNSVETPLNKQLNGLAKFITKASYAIAALIVAGRMIWFFAGKADSIDFIELGGFVLKTAMIAVTVIVVAVPEGLPMAVTLALALSMKRMLETNNLVRKMHASETMGAATVICTDKTGTLTKNQMKVHEIRLNCDFNNVYRINGIDSVSGDNNMENPEVFNRIAVTELIAVNSTAFLDFSDPEKVKALGNPTEGALLLWLHENGINYLELRENAKIIEQLTFSTERKYMATVVESPVLGKRALYIKGAPEIVMGLCNRLQPSGGSGETTADWKESVERQLLSYQNKAMRTLGFACAVIEEGVECFKDGKINIEAFNHSNCMCITFLGIAAISDPIRDEVPDAVKSCIAAGIDVKIITGDTPATAKEIGRQTGLWKDGEPESHHITGTEFAAMTDVDLLKQVLDLKIISRARPADKRRFVSLLQQCGQVVAVTGDGTNDAPALNQAHVGLSMGDGTSVAKEASDITILDNSFSSITRAVMWGRSLYQNIQRFILFQMTINVSACIIVMTGAFLGTESPLTVTQMLWVNLIMDTFAALALASLPPGERVMNDRPRKTDDFIISKSMWTNISGTGIFFVMLLFGLLQYFKHAEITALQDFSIAGFFKNYFNFGQGDGLSVYEISLFFTVFVMLQFWNMFNARAFMTGKPSYANIGKSTGFLAVAALILAGQYLIVTFGGEMFNVTPLRPVDWGLITGICSTVFLGSEIVRIIKYK
ncbi:MAG: calcium-translocating P-type ATPase, PMCA-type [Dysgonamonadaceae bacterium]|jgi:Ca2+-transporting ATPase|nr:calcium-translocating P-type ATPase, PMCA-type [Dysgonamonadaceae bacterium]